jgi:hypothetical protein
MEYSSSPTLIGLPPNCILQSAPQFLLKSHSSPTHLWYQDPVTSRNAHRNRLAILIPCTRANSQHLGLVQLFYRRLGKEDAAGRLCLCLHTLDEDAVEERRQGLDGLQSSGLLML